MSDHDGVYEVLFDKRPNEVLVLGAECAEFGDTEIFFIDAPADELGMTGGGGGVGVLNFDEA